MTSSFLTDALLAVAGLLFWSLFVYVLTKWERLKWLEARLRKIEEEYRALQQAVTEHPDYAEIRRRTYEIKHQEPEEPPWLKASDRTTVCSDAISRLMAAEEQARARIEERKKSPRNDTES